MRKFFVFLLILFLFCLRLFFLPRLDLKDGQKVRVSGILSEEPQVSSGRQRIKIGQFEVWVDRYPEFHYSDEVEIVGKVETKPLTTLSLPLPTLKSNQLVEAKVEIRSKKQELRIKGIAIELRRRLLTVFNQVFPKPYDGIVAGIVLGDKSLISKDFWQKMQLTGTLHIMVASGMNIAMFSKGVLKFFTLFFKRRVAILCLVCVIWFYSIMTGLTPPMVRAATLVSLIYLSQLLGREAEGGRVLFLTGTLMVFVNPLLIFDVGFQLSFLATAGLVWVQPKLRHPEWSPVTGGTKSRDPFPSQVGKGFLHALRLVGMTIIGSENFTSSLAAQLATLPILVVNFGQLNLLSPFINLLILWTVPYILQFGMLFGMLGLLWISGAKLASYLIFPLLFYLEQAIALSAKITFVQVSLKMGWWFAVIYYFILWLWVRGNSSRKDSRG